MMRKVYHGSIEAIRHPLTNIGRENLDFGKGFYVTDIKKQAQIWAGLKHKFYPGSKGIVNQYDLDFDTVVNKYVYKNLNIMTENGYISSLIVEMGKKYGRNMTSLKAE